MLDCVDQLSTSAAAAAAAAAMCSGLDVTDTTHERSGSTTVNMKYCLCIFFSYLNLLQYRVFITTDVVLDSDCVLKLDTLLTTKTRSRALPGLSLGLGALYRPMLSHITSCNETVRLRTFSGRLVGYLFSRLLIVFSVFTVSMFVLRPGIVGSAYS